ncbi:MAG: hypothetical protein C4582_08445 [Desulfobacteraceae bacterium]|jgi:nitrate reductase gamma subunit|nr:MAG: hypothetical protein C4582_08445 [Desulfobacteraceae bacterium]
MHIKIFLRVVLSAVFTAGYILAIQGFCMASWLLDEAAYHISAHGQTSCIECHGDTVKKSPHPNPANVSKKLPDFFTKDKCLQCHETVEQDLDRAFHGNRHIADRARYDSCLDCHDPHTQLSLNAHRKGKVDTRLPARAQCASCHEARERLPAADREQEACLSCHRAPEQGDKAPGEALSELCFYCHEQGSPAAKIGPAVISPLIAKEEYKKTPHADLSCLECHPGAAEYGHRAQEKGDCKNCHSHHHEKTAHDAHISVSCQACHLPGVAPLKDETTGTILWNKGTTEKKGDVSRIHWMIRGGTTDECRRCHVEGNTVGAAAWVLPPKGILCLPCHASTFSASDTFSRAGILVFLLGIIISLSYIFSSPGEQDKDPGRPKSSGTKEHSQHKDNGRIAALFKAILLDVFLQRRLFRQSRSRWFIHGLVFYAFSFRFLWGVIALAASLMEPPWASLRFMLDKNNPATGMFFELTGLMIILGLCLMLVRGARAPGLPGLPKQDKKALALIGGLVIAGFITEAMRIAMTGFPEGSVFSFAGYWIAGLFSGLSGLEKAYGYMWYIHAALTAAFIAYISFSRLFHMVISPVVLIAARLKR